MGVFLLGREREQPQSEVLSPERGRPKTASTRDESVAADDARNRPCDG